MPSARTTEMAASLERLKRAKEMKGGTVEDARTALLAGAILDAAHTIADAIRSAKASSRPKAAAKE